MKFLFLSQIECEVNLRKAKQTYITRCEEYEKAKTAACRAEEEGGGSTAKSVEKKKRLEEEARNKVVTSPFCHQCRLAFRADARRFTFDCSCSSEDRDLV